MWKHASKAREYNDGHKSKDKTLEWCHTILFVANVCHFCSIEVANIYNFSIPATVIHGCLYSGGCVILITAFGRCTCSWGYIVFFYILDRLLKSSYNTNHSIWTKSFSLSSLIKFQEMTKFYLEWRLKAKAFILSVWSGLPKLELLMPPVQPLLDPLEVWSRLSSFSGQWILQGIVH